MKMYSVTVQLSDGSGSDVQYKQPTARPPAASSVPALSLDCAESERDLR